MYYTFFSGELENLKKQRQREKKEDKIRAKQAELDHRKYHGLCKFFKQVLPV